MKPHPKTPNWKRALHTFYLVQPVLQFLLLAFAISALSRCSPLSPSTDKNSLKNILGSSHSASDGANALLSADWVDNSLKLVGESEMVLSTESDVDAEVSSVKSLRADTNRFLNEDPSAAAQTSRAPVLMAKLPRVDVEHLLAKGSVRLDLSGTLSNLKAEDANEALIRLRDQPELVNASLSLVLPESRVDQHSGAKLRLRVAIAILDAQHAVLELSHRLTEEPREERDQHLQALQNAALDAKHLAIIID